MAWHIPVRLALSSSLLFTLACNDGQVQDSGDVDSSPTTSTSGETTVATTSATTMEASSSGSTAATNASTAATDSSTAAADSSTGPDEPVACTEDLTCNPGEICVLPCCGGPAPGCFELPRGGECGPDGTPDEGGKSCCQNAGDPQACMKLQWCSPVGCTADPPYCTTLDQLDCNGNTCDAPGCFFGTLTNDRLECNCS